MKKKKKKKTKKTKKKKKNNKRHLSSGLVDLKIEGRLTEVILHVV